MKTGNGQVVQGRIALLSDIFPPLKGGSGRWMYEVYRRFPTGKVTFIVGQCKGCEQFDREHGELDIHRVDWNLDDWGTIRPWSCYKYLELTKTVNAILRRSAVSTVHAARVLPEGWVAFLLKKLLRFRYHIYVHGEDISTATWSREHAWMAKRILAGADLVISNSQNTAELLQSDWNRESIVLYPGVDCGFFAPAPRNTTVRERMGWGERPTVLTVGRLQRRKGHDQMIRAIDRLRTQFPDVLYAICGDGDERDSLHKLVSDLGLQRHVQFMGEVTDAQLLAAYQQCDLFALPNREVDRDIEGFGMVLVEAQACGKPVLAGDSGGTRETMAVGSTGVITDCTCVTRLAEVTSDLLSNHSRREKMGRDARTYVYSRFDWKQLSRQAEQAFENTTDCCESL